VSTRRTDRGDVKVHPYSVLAASYRAEIEAMILAQVFLIQDLAKGRRDHGYERRFPTS
jgi:hypothetical protein